MKKITRSKQKPTSSLAKQVKAKSKKDKKNKDKKVIEYDGDVSNVVSIGSTLVDLMISGTRVKGGGLPGKIMVVIYGPPGGGKTALACEFAGNILRAGGELNYKDAEARLDKPFAKKFGINIDDIEYDKPRTIETTFSPLFKWKPNPDNINGYIVDSLASLSTEMELEAEDKMGMRRAKEFSTWLRKCAVPITEQNTILFCTNQTREKADAGMYERKDVNPGGKAIEFYASLILRLSGIKNIKKEFKFGKKMKKEIIGMEATVEVVKSSIDKPFRKAPIIIYFDYGIDDIRANLQYVKEYTGNSIYQVKDIKLSNSIDTAIKMVEDQNLESKLKKQVTAIWEEYEAQTVMQRKPKVR